MKEYSLSELEKGLNEGINWFKNNWDKIKKAASFGPGTSSAVRDK